MKLSKLCEGEYQSVKDLPEYPFNNPKRMFLDCSFSGLRSLEGCPKSVRAFNGSRNNLSSLEGAPSIVNGVFDISENEIASLEHAPEYVGKDFICQHNLLTSLIGFPQKDVFNCFCFSNKLRSLEGLPQILRGMLSCFGNQITSLEHVPKRLGTAFYCYDNKISSLIGVDDFIEEMNGLFSCEKNPITEGGLGLLLIKGIKTLRTDRAPLKIISKYIEKSQQIYECQQELIENGYEAYAQL